uniref:Chondroitin proteoglycan 4 domain-containing protein n=1 Tax=Strongyloides venezuelensis TaxID=75913 RepID=A0A0K0EXD4_STRVS
MIRLKYLSFSNIIFFYLLILLQLFSSTFSKKSSDVFDKVSKETGFSAVFLNTIETGKVIKQCGCNEQEKCLNDIKTQIYSCSGNCWNIFSRVTKTPGDLKKCFDKKKDRISSFLGCFHRKSESCNRSNNIKMIPKHNITMMFEIAEKQISSRKNDIMKSAAIKPIRNVFNTTLDFAHCLKDCMIKENSRGFCFDKITCQPYLTERKTILTIKKCLKEFEWKDELAEICDCCIKAGISELNKICPMLKLMAGGSKKLHSQTKPPSTTVSNKN